MKVDSWIWSLPDDYPDPATADDTKLPLGRVWLKTHERSRWFSTAQIAHYAEVYRQQGIDLSAWCVPTGLVDDAALAIAVLNDLKAAGIAEPWLQFDVEVEPGNFWRGTPAQLVSLFQRTRAACPWARLALCVYQWDNALYGIDTVALLADRLVSMSYWTDFGTAPETQLANDYRHLSFYGRAVQMGLPGNATPDEMARALRWLQINQPATDPPPILWRRGTTSRAVWDTIAAFEMNPPVPEPSIEQVKLGLIDKLIHDEWRAARDDLAKIVQGAPV